ncbi:transcriptional regulator, partial [Lactobacillus crispatus]|nr:transcriptional regulator [Lactobacillus crispatus]
MSDFKLIIIKNLRDLKQFDKTIYFVNKVNMTLINKVQTIIKGIYGIDLNLSDDDVRNLTFAFRLSTFLDIKVQNNQEYYELLRNKYSRSFYVYRKFLERSNTELKDKSYLWFLLMMQNVINKVESIRYTSVLLAHGTSTAESIQKVVNNLAGNYIFEAFDMPIEASVNDINKLVYKYLVEQKAREKGIILLFDMGSLNQMFTKIKHSLNKELLVVNNITTATALDIAMRVQRQENFNEIATKAENYGQYLGVQYFEGLSNKKNIIVSCLSGLGLSKAIKDIMEKSLSTTHQIFTMDYRKLHSYIDNNNEQFFKNTDLIMTTTDFKTNLDLPIVNIYDILDQKGFSKLRMYLQDMGEQDKNIDD